MTSSVVVRIVPALEDNFMYLVKAGATARAALAVDPVDVNRIQEAAKEDGVQIVGALITHHHWDHAGGTPEFAKTLPGAPILGGDDRIENMSRLVKHEERLELADLKIRALSTPCHTKGHICYEVTVGDESSGVVFTGDTLFSAGCGKFFEGDGQQMQRNLNEVLASLPASTLVYPGHEYTVSNLAFARHIDPDNTAVANRLSWAKAELAAGRHTVPSTVAQEKTFNPFMRVHEASIQIKLLGKPETDLAKVMQAARDAKNNFKSSL